MKLKGLWLIWGLALLLCGSARAEGLSDSELASETESPIDREEFAWVMAHEVEDVGDLEELVRGERATYVPIVPPAADFILRQPVFPVIPFAWKSFPEKLTSRLAERQEYEFSVPVFKLRAVEDRATRQLLFYGHDDQAVLSLERPREYDPFDWLKARYPGLYSGRYPFTMVQEYEALYDPARIELLVTLIPTDSVEYYLYARAKVREYELSLARESGDGEVLLRGMGTESNIVFTGITKMTNALQIEVGYPDTFTNRLDIYRATDLLERDWQRVSGPLETTGTTSVVWLDAQYADLDIYFYAAGNHDLDSDADGFSDAFELLVLGTDPADPDSYGVYLSGAISYDGPETGTVYVQPVTESAASWVKTWQAVLPAPGAYTNLVANQQSYWLKSYMDVNANQKHDDWEPWGIYSATALYATNDVTGLDLVLEDQASIWGTLDYSGGATGNIHVLASPLPGWDTTYSTVIPWVQAQASLTGDPVYVSFPVDYSIT
ncbi:MAG: thrombospondin type 3 repeat-containing protein, partial [Candidatus Marinimicrobia bacterium]|nr:thrombospondin type 3 repeat-containing protein [Candidatus Neomarinimicrobiota bacterium]